MVSDLLKRRFMYENKDKMNGVWINYCGMPVCFGWKEFAIVTGLKYYPSSPSQVIPTLTPKKSPHTPQKGKRKSSDREDLVSIIGPSFKNKNLIEVLKGKGLSKKHKQSLCLIWFVHNILWARDVNNIIRPDLINLSEDLEAFNSYPWDYESFKMTVQYLLTPLTPKTVNLYGFPWAFMAKHDRVINAINALTVSVKKMGSKRGVIPSKRISYPYTPLEIKSAKRRRKDTSKASSSIEKSKIIKPLSLSCTVVQCATSVPTNKQAHIYFSRKQNDERYKMNESSLDFDMLDFVVAHSGMKNWFYLLPYPKLAGLMRNCSLFVVAYTEYLNDELQVPNDGLDLGLLRKIYVTLLWKYGEVKAQKLYASDIKDPR
ncbi:hypothetical protein BC332_23618 [Capsicum chinense]|nr:hypothetical protein BC332_23618 [Capsicum chinense]